MYFNLSREILPVFEQGIERGFKQGAGRAKRETAERMLRRADPSGIFCPQHHFICLTDRGSKEGSLTGNRKSKEIRRK